MKFILGIKIPQGFFQPLRPKSQKQEAQKCAVSFGEFESNTPIHKSGNYEIGCVRNGYGIKTAKVLSRNSPGEWFKDALYIELGNRGYKVSNDKNGKIVINGKVENLYIDLFMTYHSNLFALVKINKDGRNVYTETFHGNAEPIAWVGTPEEYKKAANQSLENLLRMALPKIEAKLEEIQGR